jgi:arginyl-tRNA synthetase
MIKLQLQKAISQAVEKATGIKVKPEEVHLEHPENKEFGDYSSNIAMAIFVKSKKQKAKSKILLFFTTLIN